MYECCCSPGRPVSRVVKYAAQHNQNKAYGPPLPPSLFPCARQVYCLRQLRISGDEVRLLKSYPGGWEVHVARGLGGAFECVLQQAELPSYKQLEGLLRGLEWSQSSKPLLERVNAEMKVGGRRQWVGMWSRWLAAQVQSFTAEALLCQPAGVQQPGPAKTSNGLCFGGSFRRWFVVQQILVPAQATGVPAAAAPPNALLLTCAPLHPMQFLRDSLDAPPPPPQQGRQ